MRKLSIVALFCALAGALSAADLRIVNAASLSSVSLAPGSIFTIFGTNLTNGVTNATNVQTPPTTLGGVTVSIGGSPASLFYVSPTQINGVINPLTPTGIQTVVVTSARGTQTGSVTIATIAPPGLFSLFGTGTRDGAVLNAITFLLGDFSTRSANSPTYLAFFATGLNLSIMPSVTIGGIPVQVVFFGAAPCCFGLQQINVMLTDSLAGAGRVPVVVTSAGQASNTVQVVLLPPPDAKQFEDDEDNKTRSRELASLAYVPETSLVLVTDENDDVVRVVDVVARKVTRVIALSDDAKPVGIAVNAAGTLAVVAEAGLGKAAVIDLAAFKVVSEISTGPGPVSVAIAGSQAVVVNKDNDTVSIIDLTGTIQLQKTLPTGHGPEDVAVDAASRMAFVTNENDGTVTVINLATLAVANTFTLGAAVRPHDIALITGAGVAFVTAPAAGPEGTAILLNLTTGATISTISANPDRSGGSTAAAYYNSKIYFANQTGGSVSVLPMNPATGAATGPATTIKVDLGARALAIDTKDNLLVVSNEGSGTLVLISLATNTVVGRISAVRTDMPGDSGKNDHSDREGASNLPAVQSLSPSSAKAGTTFTLTITGVNLTGATGVTFARPGGKDEDDDKDKGKGKKEDDEFAASNVQVAAGGTRITATVSIPAGAKPGARVVRVITSNGTSSGKGEGAAMFVVMP